MKKISIIFCGSFRHYSATVLEGLLAAEHLDVRAVVTTPPRPAGRSQELRKTAVHRFAEEAELPVYAPETLDDESLEELGRVAGGAPDFLLTAGYGKLIPSSWLTWPARRPLNLHFSLLPAYRGANPAEWALLMDAEETGITLMEMDENFDTGAIIAQEAYAITRQDTRETIYQTLYQLGATNLPQWLQPDQLPLETRPQPQHSPTPYARLLKRDDGYIAWPLIEAALRGEASSLAATPAHHLGAGIRSAWDAAEFTQIIPAHIERAIRALHGYPGIWTQLPTGPNKQKRMKLFSAQISDSRLELQQVQIAGQQRALWKHVQTSYYENF